MTEQIPGAVEIRRLDRLGPRDIADLARVLVDCVQAGASVSFMHPLSEAKAAAFWERLAGGVAAGARVLLVAADANGIMGTVQVVLEQTENQPHRADVSKMLVHTSARRRGVGAALMRAAEHQARAAGKTLLVLDTATGSDAERLYRRLGWTLAGVVPDYALFPHGGFCDTSIYYRKIS